MSREIRKVPPYWVHPKKEGTDIFQPMRDENYDEAVKEYVDSFILWEKGEHPVQLKHKEKLVDGFRYEPDPTREGSVEACAELNNPDYYMPWAGYHYWDYVGSAPEKEYYHSFKKEDATWFQLYETVSEGTPVTPSFSTLKELKNHLVQHGDFWGDKWSEKSAQFVIEKGGVMSGLMTGGRFYTSSQMGDVL